MIRGVIAMKECEYENAYAEFSEALRLDPQNSLTLYRRGTVLQTLDRHEDALEDLHRAVLLNPQYTAPYCNQRALVNAGTGNFHLALADYGIALQIDPNNVAALSGRERVQRTLHELAQVKQAQPKHAATSAAHAPLQGNGKGKGHPGKPQAGRIPGHSSRVARPTQVMPAFRATGGYAALNRSRPAVPARAQAPAVAPESSNDASSADFEIILADHQGPVELSLVSDSEVRLVGTSDSMPSLETTRSSHSPRSQLTSVELLDDSQTAATLLLDPNETVDDEAESEPEPILEPVAESEPEISLEPAVQQKVAPAGPISARGARDQLQEGLLERQRMWAEMRYREKVRAEGKQLGLDKATIHGSDFDAGLWLRRTLIALAACALLGGVGYGGYFIYTSIANADFKVTPQELHEEFSLDGAEASAKYKGKFVQISGKVSAATDGKAAKFAFDPPSGSKWAIEFYLRKDDVKSVKSGQEIKIRCRLNTRNKPEDNLTLNNVTLLGTK